MLTLLVFICPPLAVLLTAPGSHAVKNVGLTLLFYVPGMLHARAAVERYTVQRRYDSLMNLLEKRPVTVPARLPKTKRRQTAGYRAA